MKYYADLHIHSRFSRATSRELDLERLHEWAQRKGIAVVGTGDCVHPQWLDELSEKLEPAEEGLFQLRKAHRDGPDALTPPSCRSPVRFLLSTEISNIYKRGGKVRKVHNLILLPSFEAARKLQARLDAAGNIKSDGRPILGLDSQDLLAMVLECGEGACLIPAHIWTPWFSLLGSKSGFDSIEECFGDLTKHIFAVETGLSSDPPMNWRLSQLDRYALISNSDAHSPSKLGREATVFDASVSYPAMMAALQNEHDSGLIGTVEFFPEEGKYHFDGHRKCMSRMHPAETIAQGGACPVCGKPVTVGVMARTVALADREEGLKPPRARPFWSFIPLAEIVGEAFGVGSGSKRVQRVVEQMLRQLGNEFFLLSEAPEAEIARVGGALVGEGVRRMRAGAVTIDPGYDGEFGTIRLFSDKDRAQSAQVALFGAGSAGPRTQKKTAKTARAETARVAAEIAADYPRGEVRVRARVSETDSGKPPALNGAQWRAVRHEGSHLLIVAGPGTGKTHTLIWRISQTIPLLGEGERLLAITFTNKAAEEMAERIIARCGETGCRAEIGTFHQISLGLLRAYAHRTDLPPTFTVADERQCRRIAATAWQECSSAGVSDRLDRISLWKAGVTDAVPEGAEKYVGALRDAGFLDYDDLLTEAAVLLEGVPSVADAVRSTYRHVFVDEFQDLNPVQIRILRLLVQSGVRLTAIGDPNQAIYGFRGADVGFFGRFTELFPDASVLHLSENYRSGALLLEAAGQVLASGGEPSPLIARLRHKGRFIVHEASSERAEAEYTVRQIEKLVGGSSMFSYDSGRVESHVSAAWSFSDFAVLYRLHAQSAACVEALERSGIPYQIAGKRPLGSHPLTNCIVGILRILCNASISAGDYTEAGFVFEEAVKTGFASADNKLDSVSDAMNSAAAKICRAVPGASDSQAFVARELTLMQSAVASGTGSFCAYFSDKPWFRPLVRSWPDGAEIWGRLEALAARSNTALRLLDSLALRKTDESVDKRYERVSLMTAHAAKGLEFPVVFIMGCEDGLFPLNVAGMQSSVDEERRLFYVALTRARETVYCTRARKRLLFGTSRTLPVSRFLQAVEESLVVIDREQRRRLAKPTIEAEQISLFE